MSLRALSVVGLAAALSFAPAALADAKVDERTKTQFGGAVGKMANVFGGKAVKEGIVTTTTVKGDRRMASHQDTGQLVDLAEEKVYELNFAKQFYTVKPFDDIRREMREALQRAKQQQPERSGEQAPQLDFDFDIKETGKRERISGYDCREILMTVTVRQKGKKLEEAGGVVLKGDLWLGPKLAPLAEIESFELRYFKQLNLAELLGVDLQAIASAALAPGVQEAMKKFHEKRIDMDGSALRTVMTIETVPGPAGARSGRTGDEAPSASIGGMFGRLGAKIAGGKKGSGQQAGGAAQTTLMTTTVEVLSASSDATTADVSIPAGFKQRYVR